jgi:hypothetical protein
MEMPPTVEAKPFVFPTFDEAVPSAEESQEPEAP